MPGTVIDASQNHRNQESSQHCYLILYTRKLWTREVRKLAKDHTANKCQSRALKQLCRACTVEIQDLTSYPESDSEGPVSQVNKWGLCLKGRGSHGGIVSRRGRCADFHFRSILLVAEVAKLEAEDDEGDIPKGPGGDTRAVPPSFLVGTGQVAETGS